MQIMFLVILHYSPKTFLMYVVIFIFFCYYTDYYYFSSSFLPYIIGQLVNHKQYDVFIRNSFFCNLLYAMPICEPPGLGKHTLHENILI